jgi:hypothetical protein
MSFFSKAVDTPTSIMANRGNSSTVYTAGKMIGVTILFVANPAVAIVATLGKLAYQGLFGNNTAKYYYLNPNMPMYWSTVNTLATNSAIELGFIGAELNKGKRDYIGTPIEMDSTSVKQFNKVYGTMFRDDGWIDVNAIINHTQIMINDQMKKETEFRKKNDITQQEWIDFLNSDVRNKKAVPYERMLDEVLQNEILHGKGGPAPKPDKSKPESEFAIPKSDGTFLSDIADWLQKYGEESAKYIESTAKSGGRHAIFRVEYTGETTTTFTNSVKDIPSKDIMNSMGGVSRDIMFNLAGGNVVGETMQHAVQALTDLGQGILSGFTFGVSNVIRALMGGGYIDMPKMYADSSYSAPSYNFSMELNSPYGHPVARFKNELLPMFMLMAAGLPLETGAASYTSPFLCKAFMRGKVAIEMGMITNISITRGTSNLAFNKDGHALGIKVDFTITDFSNIMAAPVNSNIRGPFELAMKDDTPLANFMATVGSRDLHTTKYWYPKAQLRFLAAKTSLAHAADPSFVGTMIGDMASSVLGGFMDDTSLASLNDE